jgi:autotransporter strand-loop-strand O-heptosyltransferase
MLSKKQKTERFKQKSSENYRGSLSLEGVSVKKNASNKKIGELKVQFKIDGELIHADWLEARQWARANRRYYTAWQIEVLDHRRKPVFQHKFDLRGQRVRINFDSKSLGDTLAWLPQAAQFALNHPETEVYLSQFWPKLFDQSAYPRLNFIDPKEQVRECYATYKIGYFFDDIDNCHPTDPRLIPLGQVAADVLGVEYQERLPILKTPNVQPNKYSEKKETSTRMVAIAMASTAACKHWLYPGGWQQLVDWLKEQGYTVMVIQKEDFELNGVIDESGDQAIERRIIQIQNADLFIGLGSGLSWLAWACDTPTVLISGFSQPFAEFQNKCYRVVNTQSCHGCWNNTSYTFDRGDWNWCPEHRKTDREHECSKTITRRVIESVQAALGS